LQGRAPFGVDVVVAGGFELLELSHEVDLRPRELVELFAQSRLLADDAGIVARRGLWLWKVHLALRSRIRSPKNWVTAIVGPVRFWDKSKSSVSQSPLL
jgi:hypothetical protein